MASDMRVKNTPEGLDINITNRCNLRCSYCSHFSSGGDTNTDLSTEEWLMFFRELKDCAVKDVTLAGGEPLIREDLRELITGIHDNRMRFSILSNGTLITDDLADF
ncbi:MAG: radical SAM protein, partial [Victivallaceae bacterium]